MEDAFVAPNSSFHYTDSNCNHHVESVSIITMMGNECGAVPVNLNSLITWNIVSLSHARLSEKGRVCSNALTVVALIAESVGYDPISLTKQLIWLASMLERNLRNRSVDLLKWPENDRGEAHAAGRVIAMVT